MQEICDWDKNNLIQIKLVEPNPEYIVDAYICAECGRIFVIDSFYKRLREECVAPEGWAIKQIVEEKRARVGVENGFYIGRTI